MNDTARMHTVTVRIAGEEHSIRSEAQPEHTRACAEHVDRAIAAVKERVSLVEPHKAAILAALSITDELFRVRAELERLSADLAGRLDGLRRRVEEVMDGR